MTRELIRAGAPDITEEVIQAACHGCAANTRRAYERAIRHFLAWWTPSGRPFDRQTTSLFLDTLGERSPASYNQALSALKRLSSEAAANGWLEADAAARIDSLRSRKTRGVRSGIWLTRDQASALLKLPDAADPSGLRDLAVLSLAIGCGLRRFEVCILTWEHFETLDDRLHIVNLKGKGGRVRTLRVPEYVEKVLALWRDKCRTMGVTEGPVVRAFRSDGALTGSLSPSSVRSIVVEYSKRLGRRVAPHDLRRTFAKLARKGGAPLEVLQRTLGHASLTTTERYVNSGEEANAGDYLQL